MRKTYSPGKVDYNGTGRKVNAVEIDWEIKDGRFSASGGIWNNNRTDYITCGQNLINEILELFPEDEQVQRIHSVWKTWHLNDMIAGSPKQMSHLAKLNPPSSDHFDWAKEKLRDAGLEPDESFIHNDKPYSYGSAWLKTDLPEEVVSEIESWKSDNDE